MILRNQQSTTIEQSPAISYLRSLASRLMADASIVYTIEQDLAQLWWVEGIAPAAVTATFETQQSAFAQVIRGRKSMYLQFETKELLKRLNYNGDLEPNGLYVLPLVNQDEVVGIVVFFCNKFQQLPSYRYREIQEAEAALAQKLLLLIYQVELQALKQQSSPTPETGKITPPPAPPAKVVSGTPASNTEIDNWLGVHEIETFAHIGLWRVDLAQNKTEWSAGMYEILAIDPSNEASMTLYRALMQPEDSKILESKLQRAVLFHEPFAIEHSFFHQSNEPAYLRLSGQAIFDDNNKPVRLVGTVQNITATKVSELENEKLAVVAAKTDNGVLVLDHQLTVEWINKSFSRILGYELNDIKGTDIFQKLVGEKTKATTHQKIIDGLKNIDAFVIEVLYYDKYKNPCWLELNLTPNLRFDGYLLNYIILINDISERKKTEEQLKELNKQLIDRNRDITDSIEYARRIQFSILPDTQILTNNFPNSFIHFLPKDIVSGDFYWFTREENYFYLAAVDCTGHGVPGAFMSVLGHSQLSEIIKQMKITDTDEILNHLHRRIVNALNQNELGQKVLDGMDVALCRIDIDNNKLSFSGANRPVSIVQSGELTELRADKNPIGSVSGSDATKERKFSTQEVIFKQGDTLYLFSDGVTDQFGGKDSKKLTKNRFVKFLMSIYDQKMEAQQQEIVRFMSEWQGGLAQTDDILVIGIRF